MPVKLHLNFKLTVPSYRGIDKKIARIWRRQASYVEAILSKELQSAVAELSVTFAGSTRIRNLNRDYRGKDKTTDVLSFPVHEKPSKLKDPHLLLGDLFIDLSVAKKQAIYNGLTLEQELTRLMIHGLYHLLGYDHELSEKEAIKMRRAEQKLVDLFNIPIQV